MLPPVSSDAIHSLITVCLHWKGNVTLTRLNIWLVLHFVIFFLHYKAAVFLFVGLHYTDLKVWRSGKNKNRNYGPIPGHSWDRSSWQYWSMSLKLILDINYEIMCNCKNSFNMRYITSISKIWCITLHHICLPFHFVFILFFVFFFISQKSKCVRKYNPTFFFKKKRPKMCFPKKENCF